MSREQLVLVTFVIRDGENVAGKQWITRMAGKTTLCLVLYSPTCECVASCKTRTWKRV
jgi:hypothetical protein